MKRKQIVAWVLLVVGIVMLAASVLPHHHHAHILCLHNDVAACDCSCEGTTHHEATHHETCNDHCVTNFVSVSPEGIQADFLPNYFICLPYFTLADVLSIPLPISIAIDNQIPWYLEVLYVTCEQHVMGLRAPPSMA